MPWGIPSMHENGFALQELEVTSTTNTQHTLNAEISFSGKGLHNGRNNRVNLLPAPIGTGVIFRRVDQPAEVPADWRHIREYTACTCLADAKGHQFRTVEHLLAALYACRITNVIVELDGEEIPILDGSAAPLIALIDSVGVQPQGAALCAVKVLRPVEFRQDNRFIRVEPAEAFQLDVSIALAKIGPLNWAGTMSPEIFRREIMGARSFGRWRNGLLAKLFSPFMKEPVYRGAGPDCALVILGDKVINKEGLRYPDEFVRHRVLDIIGDLRLAGADIIGRVTANSTAHHLNHGLLRALFADNANWRWQ